jgi:hypothetical protein
MKGVALPIEVLVIVVVAVIVLLGIIAVFFTGWSPFASTAGIDAIKNEACRKIIYNCTKNTASVPITGVTGSANLLALCTNYYNAPTEPECKRLCGCIL